MSTEYIHNMAMYAEPGGHVAKRPRVDFTASPQLHITTTSLASSQGNGLGGVSASSGVGGHNHAAGGAGGGILSPQYIEQQLTRKSHEPEKPNHILLFTVLNPTYPVTCDVLNTICSATGKVLRIVIFKKNGVQAMVEFESVDTAKTAKENLHGCDIYSGCCTLKIEYAKPTKLNVYKNDSDSYDFTNPNLGKGLGVDGTNGSAGTTSSATVSQRPVLLTKPAGMQQDSARHAAAAAQAAAVMAHQAQNPAAASMGAATNGLTAAQHHTLQQAAAANREAAAQATAAYENGLAMSNFPQIEVLNSAAAASIPVTAAGLVRIPTTAVSCSSNSALLRGGTPILSTPLGLAASAAAAAAGQQTLTTAANGTAAGYQHQGSVCMVYGLNLDRMNAARSFNLFCLYGNVVRIKFLKTKEGCAMVQMGDALAVERGVSNLNNTTFFGSKMQLGFSKQAFLADVANPYQLPDGTPSFQDFMGSKNNRFINPEMASKNRIQPPSKILHFFNTPPGLEADNIETLFTEHGSPKPKCVKMFPSKTERSSSGLIEFESLSDALEGLVICNHQPVANPNGKFPYIMKLCFSSSRSIPATIR